MRVSHLALDDFRSWKRVVLELPAGPLVFLGHNGQGKTNLVEAIAYLSLHTAFPLKGRSYAFPLTRKSLHLPELLSA